MSSGPTFSPDGNYFWDGHSWQSALSPDGQWRWNGSQWVPAPAGAAPPAPVGAAAPARTATRPLPTVRTPAVPSWQVVTPEARSLADATPAAAAPPMAGTLPGMDGTRRRGTRVIGYRKLPTAWTKPLVTLATLYFVGSGLLTFLLAAALAPEYHDRAYAALRASSQITSNDAETLATTITSIVVATLVVVASIGMLLGILSFRRLSLIFYIQMVFCFFALLSFMNSVSTPAEQRAAVAPGIFWGYTALDAVGAVLFFLMLFARRAYGPWGLRRVPVYAEPT